MLRLRDYRSEDGARPGWTRLTRPRPSPPLGPDRLAAVQTPCPSRRHPERPRSASFVPRSAARTLPLARAGLALLRARPSPGQPDRQTRELMPLPLILPYPSATSLVRRLPAFCLVRVGWLTCRTLMLPLLSDSDIGNYHVRSPSNLPDRSSLSTSTLTPALALP